MLGNNVEFSDENTRLVYGSLMLVNITLSDDLLNTTLRDTFVLNVRMYTTPIVGMVRTKI